MHAGVKFKLFLVFGACFTGCFFSPLSHPFLSEQTERARREELYLHQVVYHRTNLRFSFTRQWFWLSWNVLAAVFCRRVVEWLNAIFGKTAACQRDICRYLQAMEQGHTILLILKVL